MEISVQINVTDSHSNADKQNKPVLSWDEIIEKSLSNFGWMDFLQAILVAISMFFDAQQSFISIYTDNYPKWHCTNTTTNSTCSSSSDICKLPRSSWSWDTHPSNTIISQWNLECASTFLTGLPQSSFFVGSLLGSSILAALADSSLGRKNMLIVSCLSMSITSMLIILSTNVWIYSAMKFLIGFWRSSIGTCALVLLTEKVNVEWRFRAGIVEYFMFTIGYMSLPGFAYINRNSSWKSLYRWSSIPGIIYSIIAYFFVTESPRWLVMQGNEKEISKMLKMVSSQETADGNNNNNCNLASSFPKPPIKEKVSIFQLYSSIGELFHKRWALKRMISVMILGIGLGMVYYGMPLAVGNLGFNIYLAGVFSASMEIPSCVAIYFLENYRRKPSILVFSILSGICCVMCVVLEHRVPAGKVVLAMVAFFGACTAYDLFLIYVIELFPTRVRNTATSLVRQAVVFGCIFCPFLVSAGRKNNIFSYGVFGVVIMLSNITLLYLPETKGIVLCDTMEEQEKKEIALSDDMHQHEITGNVSVQ
ncbi:organic cation/carnitine transporter 3-like [Lathyrus oleraceus]|uniref:organic cation/carnitine transporter 3-like n=1 Tax=Pisum sativum TaxID=3888 RepID=UPI001FC5F8A0|nr:organic cation/carnitine transporter 3-like [Pisum sativum]